MTDEEIVFQGRDADIHILQATRPAAPNGRDYMVRVTEFPRGLELVLHRPKFAPGAAMLAPMKLCAADQLSPERKRELSIARAVRRAVQMVRFKCKTIKADHLLTVTYRGPMTDRTRLAADWQKFYRAVRKRFPEWQYVMVVEKHESGGFHMHAAVVGRQDVRWLRKCWWDVVGEAQGNIDVRGPRKRWGNESDRWSAHKLAAYMTKYLSKEMSEAEAEKKRYWSTKGIVIKQYRYWLGATSYGEAVKEAMCYVQAFDGKKLSMWGSDDWSVLWVEASG